MRYVPFRTHEMQPFSPSQARSPRLPPASFCRTQTNPTPWRANIWLPGWHTDLRFSRQKTPKPVECSTVLTDSWIGRHR
jgi:hypothetical protein